MNDTQKTLAFIAAGAVAMIVGIAPWQSTATGPTLEDETGRKLFEDFDNPLSASSLEIIEFNEDNSTMKQFKVAQANGIWAIPSHQDYPADAQEHLATAATALIGVEKLGVAGESPGEHEVFGVIDPDISKLKAGATGVGERITLKDGSGNTLADLIVGKEVKDQPGVRYVRIAGKSPVYRVELSTEKFSTKFEDWIEKDLLKLNTFDIREIDINNYTLQEGLDNQGAPSLGQARSSEVKLKYDDAKSAWSLEDLVTYEKRKAVKVKLGDGEELNSEKLNELRNALDDLKIVDVERKPKGLGGDLSINAELVQDRQALNQLAMSLAARGFMPVALNEQKLELLSTDGEVICKLKDGVNYVVRFGRVAAGGDSGKKSEKTGLDRYVMITAQLDESAIAKPELESLPSSEDAEPATDVPADAKTPTKPAAKDAKVEEKKPALTAEEEAAKKTVLEEKTAQIEKANKRKQDEYDEKIKKAEEKVKELNDRFANWYYVIADDVYKKVHLDRTDIVKKKEPEPDAGGDKPVEAGGVPKGPAKK